MRAIVPISGKRRCLGEQLARSTLFLFFTYVVHYFDIEISAEHSKPNLNGYDGFTMSPKPYYLKLTKRSSRDDDRHVTRASTHDGTFGLLRRGSISLNL